LLPREELFFRILIFFALFTLVTGVVNLAASGSITIRDVSAAVSSGVGVSGTTNLAGTYTEGANTASGTSITGIDFTTIPQINQNVTTLIGGPWTLTSGQGLKLTGLPLLPGALNPSAVILRNAQSVNGIYTENVLIDNSMSGGDFYLFPRFIDGYSGSDLKVVFSSDGVHVKKFPLVWGFIDAGDDYFYPMPGASTTLAGGSTITTALTESVSSSPSNIPDYTAKLTVSKDGVTLFTTTARAILPGNNINDMVRHGGAGSDSQNFIVKGFASTPILDTSASIISGSLGGASMNPSDAPAGFLSLVGAAFGVNQAAIVPWWLWLIVGGPCLAVMSLIYIEILRGV